MIASEEFKAPIGKAEKEDGFIVSSYQTFSFIQYPKTALYMKTRMQSLASFTICLLLLEASC